jgi:hypothetical protein
VLAAGACAEEVAFRGYPFQRLIEAIGPVAAAIVLSLLFGAVHFLNPHASVLGFLNTALIGLLLAFAYLRTRTLWMSIAIHFFWNLTLGLVFGLPVSGLTLFSVVTRARAVGPLWLTGGSYGIEASAETTIVVVLALMVVVVFVKARAPVAEMASHGGDTWLPEVFVQPSYPFATENHPQPRAETDSEAPIDAASWLPPKDSDSS